MQALNLLSSTAWEHLVITLLHTLWQGTLVGLVLLVSLRFLPASRANARYVVSFSALALTVVAGVFTFAILESAATVSVTPVSVATALHTPPDHQEIPVQEAAQPVSAPAPRSTIATPDTDSRASWNIAWKPVVAAVWLFGVSMMLLRIVVLVAGTSGLRRAEPVTDSAVLEMVDALRRQLGLSRTIRVVSTAKISTPAVFGVLWPVLVLPASFASGVAPDQLRLILSHELAHIRRHDYLVNLVQMMVEAVLFFNPAIWWISRQVRTEREACADALAVRQTESPDDYVAALAQWAESDQHGSLAQSFAGDARRGSLLERVRRLLIPQYQPTAKMPWLSLIAVFLVATVIFAGMHWGGKKVVAVAVQMMSPKERVEAVVKVQQEVAPQLTDNWPKERTFSGTIETEDGGSLHNVLASYSTKSSTASGHTGHSYSGRVFSAPLPNHATKVWFTKKGYAPIMLGPFAPGTAERVEDIRVVFKRGFTAQIRCVDEKGTPLSDARFKLGVHWSDRSSGGYAGVPETFSGDNGIALTENATEGPYYTLNVLCPGFQRRFIRSVSFSPTRPFDVVLQKAQAVTGVVLDSDGQPVVDAKVVASTNLAGHTDELVKYQDVITTDNDGRFTLGTLSDSEKYYVHVVASGYGPAVQRHVLSGQTGLRFVLSPERRIRGQITGDLLLLQEIKGKRYLWMEHAFRTVKHSITAENFKTLVEIDGDIGRFESPNFVPGRVVIYLANERKRLDLTEEINNLQLTIRETEILKRPVVIHFKPADDSDMVPSGTVRVHSHKDEPKKYEYQELEIKDGQVAFDAFVPGQVSYTSVRIPGYWVKEETIRVEMPESGDHTEPLETTVKLKPAGAISGQIIDYQGRLLTTDKNTNVSWTLASGEEHWPGHFNMASAARCQPGPNPNISPVY